VSDIDGGRHRRHKSVCGDGGSAHRSLRKDWARVCVGSDRNSGGERSSVGGSL